MTAEQYYEEYNDNKDRDFLKSPEKFDNINIELYYKNKKHLPEKEKEDEPLSEEEPIVALGGYTVPPDGTYEPDISVPEIKFNDTNIIVNEGETAKISIRRANDSLLACCVDFRTLDGLAIKGEDYIHTEGTIYFDQGDIKSKQIEIQTCDDSVINAGEEETFYVELYIEEEDVNIVDNKFSVVSIKKV
tara:strand:+ start:41 stop:607 length:567 start_codon:yes stop_codon:yes gene_type:complete